MTGSILTCAADQYHADMVHAEPTLSKSILHTLLTSSPAHARAAHPRLNPDFVREEDPKFDLGTASHALFLEGDANVHVVYADDWRTKDAKEQRQLARTHGRTPMLEKHYGECVNMTQALRAQCDNRPEGPLFTDGTPEQTIVWQENGVWCRARLDWLLNNHTAVHDLKTTKASANPDAWTRTTMWGIGADLQAAFYLRGLSAVLGCRPEFLFVVAEVFQPFALSVVGLTPAALALADAKVDWALNIWKRCLETDSWPAYPTRVCYAEPPGWAEAQWLEREAREDVAA